MSDRTKVIGQTNPLRPGSHRKGSIHHRIDQVSAAITAQCIMTESLMHALCLELPELSRTRLLNVLDAVHDQLEAGLGSDAEIVQAFGEQRNSLRTLLVSSVIMARMELDL